MAVRPIDGNKLIEWFSPYLHTGEPIPADVVIEDIRSMPTLTPPNEWVSVEERLPEIGGSYLCVWQGRKVDTGFFLNGHFRLYGEIKDHLITHWMPLPALPDRRRERRETDGQ